MDFEVHTRDGSAKHTGDARYLIDDNNGVLSVYAHGGSRYRYSPAYWTSVSDRPDDSVPAIGAVFTG